jgi:hypothetical protein
VLNWRFTTEDVARTRFSTAPAPLSEAALMLAELRRAAPAPPGACTRRAAPPGG